MNPEIAAAVREDWYWRLFFAQWIAIGKVAMQRAIDDNQKFIIDRLKNEAAHQDTIITNQKLMIASQKDIIANLEKLAAPIDDQLATINRQIDDLDKATEAVQMTDARYIAALEAALDEAAPGWRGRVSREPVPSA